MNRPSRRELIKWFGYGAATAVAPAIYGDASTGWLQVVRKTIHVGRWDQNGFKVAFLSDFHAMDTHRVEVGERAIDLAIAENPDAILLGGDYLNDALPRRLRLLSRLLERFEKARCPVVGVLGNHDFWSEDIHSILKVFARSTVTILRNEPFQIGGVFVAGVDDGIAGKQNPDFIRNLENRDSVLALYHEPDFVTDLPSNTSLMLAGHSHGGQICLPGGLPIHTPRGAWKYTAGWYPAATVPLYVSKGVGTVGPDYRLFCRPEVTILTIARA